MRFVSKDAYLLSLVLMRIASWLELYEGPVQYNVLK